MNTKAPTLRWGRIFLTILVAGVWHLPVSAAANRNQVNFVIPGLDDDPTVVDENGVSIKLPELPAKRSSYSTTGGASGSGPTSRQGMRTLDRSAFPNMTCSLVDNRPYLDLVSAVQALSKVVVLTPECQNNSDIVKMNQTTQALLTAAQSLQEKWSNLDSIASSQGEGLNQFNSDLTTLITGIESISSSLANNSLINSNCGKQIFSVPDALVALGDLTSSAAPFALAGASLSPQVAVAVPFILGLTGIGSVAKILKNLHDQNTLDTSKPENRQAVLQNICEFSKISTRVHFMKLAQTGQLEEVTKELSEMKQTTLNLLKLKFSDRAFQISGIRDNELKSLAASLGTARRDQQELNETSELIGDLSSPDADLPFACYTMRDLVANDDQDAFPNRTVLNFKRLLGRQTEVTTKQTSLLKTEARLRSQMIANLSDDSNQGIESCANLSKSYVRAISMMVAETQQTVRALYQSLDQQLTKDSEFAAFLSTKQELQREEVTMEKVAGLLKRLNQDNSVIDKVELDAQLSELKRALFGKRIDGVFGFLNGLLYQSGGESPALAWLKFVDDQWNSSMRGFENEMKSLVADAYALTVSGKAMMYRTGLTTTYETDIRNWPLKMQKGKKYEQYALDRETALNLANITPALAPKDSANQRTICRRLENIWFEWAAAMDQLGAQEFFCENIRSLFDTNTEPDLVKHCDGKQDLTGKVLQSSTIKERRDLMVQKGLKEQALVVSLKMKELSCPVPDMSVMQ